MGRDGRSIAAAMVATITMTLLLATSASAQDAAPGRGGKRPVAGTPAPADASRPAEGKASGQPGGSADGSAAAPKFSDGARAALAAARELANKAKGLEGSEKMAALQAAATAYDKVATDFVGEPPAAAQAAYGAAGLWRRHESPAAAEKAFLLAARLDAARYGQRGRLGAADMQRRQDHTVDALASYAEAAAVDPTTARAHTARLGQGRLLLELGRGEEAVAVFRAAVAAARTPPQMLEAGNMLARALVAQGEFEAAGRAIAQVETAVNGVGDPQQRERLQKACESMSARRVLQRALDKATGRAGDAADLESSREKPRGGG